MKPLVAAVLAALSTTMLAGCAVGDRGLETVHQPVVSATEAHVPGCPVWDQALGERESQSPNFGCATMTNLAAMIAEPQDLLHGRTDATPAEVATRAIKAWRDTEPTGKQWQVTTRQASTSGGK